MWYRQSQADRSNPVYEEVLIRYLLEQAVRLKYFNSQNYNPSNFEIMRHVENILKYIKETYSGVGNLRNSVTKDKQMKDVWTIGRPKKIEKELGKHPTQKPEEIIERMVLSSTNENDLILDMTLVAINMHSCISLRIS
jgi:DNA modification methylase